MLVKELKKENRKIEKREICQKADGSVIEVYVVIDKSINGE